jgi:hypothetical protein
MENSNKFRSLFVCCSLLSFYNMKHHHTLKTLYLTPLILSKFSFTIPVNTTSCF